MRDVEVSGCRCVTCVPRAREIQKSLCPLRVSNFHIHPARARDTCDSPSRRLLQKNGCAGRRSRLKIQAGCRPTRHTLPDPKDVDALWSANSTAGSAPTGFEWVGNFCIQETCRTVWRNLTQPISGCRAQIDGTTCEHLPIDVHSLKPRKSPDAMALPRATGQGWPRLAGFLVLGSAKPVDIGCSMLTDWPTKQRGQTAWPGYTSGAKSGGPRPTCEPRAAPSLGTANRDIAEKRFREWVADLDAHKWGDRPRRSFEEAAARFIKEHLPTVKRSTAVRYGVSLKYLAAIHFSGSTLDEIKSAELSEFETARRTYGVTPATIRRDLACLSGMFMSAIDWEWIDDAQLRVTHPDTVPQGQARPRGGASAHPLSVGGGRGPAADARL